MRFAALELPALCLQLALRDRPGGREHPVVLVARRAGQDVVVAATAAARALGVEPGTTAAQAHALVAGLEDVVAAPRRAARALRDLAEALLALAPVVEVAPPEALLLDAAAARLALPARAAAPPATLAGAEEPEMDPSSSMSAPDASGGWPVQRSRELLWGEAVLSCAADLGFDGRLGIADTPEAARLVAAQLAASDPASGRVRTVPPGLQSRVMAGVPVDLVARLGNEALEAVSLASDEGEPAFGADEAPILPALGPAAVELLGELGLRRLGKALELPPRALVERLGNDAARLLALARGGSARPLRAFRPGESLVEVLELDGWVEDAAGLVFALRPLAERLAARLTGRGLVAARIALELETEPPRADRRSDETPEPAAARQPDGPASLPPPKRARERLVLELARPTAQPRVIVDLLREKLGALSLAAPVVAAALEVAEAAQRRDQLGLGERPRTQEALDSVLSRLRSRLGDDAVGALQVRPDWLPERATGRVPFDPAHRADSWSGAARARGGDDPVPAARLRPPDAPASGPFAGLLPRPTRLLEPEEIAPDLDPSGRPRAFAWRGRRHRVLAATMPENLSTGWWARSEARQYVTLLLGDGARVWAFRNPDGRWWLHGVHD